MTHLTWTEAGQPQQAAWYSDNHLKPPRQLQVIEHNINAEAALKLARQGTALLWRGDYHQAKQLLAAMQRRLHGRHRNNQTADEPIADAFHKHRLRQAQAAQTLHMLCVLMQPGWWLNLPRAPQLQAACREAFGGDHPQPLLLPLKTLLGWIGAHEWHQRGVPIAALGGQHIHVPFGVFSPLRGEYLALFADAPLPEPTAVAWDIGTGSGVLAAILAQRGAAQVCATDTNPRALACAAANLHRLGLAERVHLMARDLFPDGQADLIVCNPPWLPAKPTSAIETALYDPQHQMLRRLLDGAATHLRPGGELWLIMSDLAEHLGLRSADFLVQAFQAASWQVLAQTSTQPRHAKATDTRDPLAWARSRELTSLWRLQPLPVDGADG